MTDQPNSPLDAEPMLPAADEMPSAPDASPAPDASELPSGPSAAEAWETVVLRMRELGDAVAAWTKAATDTPENRRHLDEVRAGVNDMARQANDAFSSVASSDFGRQVTEGATQVGQAIGETAHEFGQAAAPHVASAFAGLADAFGRAAHKVSESVAPPAAPHAAPSPAAEEPAPAPAAPAPPAPEPPAAPTPPQDLGAE